MWRHVLNFCFFLVGISASFCQTSEIDSLENLLPKLSDSTKIEVLHKLTIKLMHRDVKRAQGYAEESLALSQVMQKPYLVNRAQNDLGITAAIAGNHPLSIKSFQKAYQGSTHHGDTALAAYALKGLGNVHQLQSNWTKAIDYFKESLHLYQSLGRPSQINAALNNLGIAYKASERQDSALKYLEARLDHSRANGYRAAESSALNNLAGMYKDMQIYDRAIHLYKQSLAIKKELKQKRGEALVLGNLGEVYARQGNFDASEEHFLQSIKIRKQIKDERGVALNSNRLAAFLLRADQPATAIKHAEVGLQLSKQIGLLDFQAESLRILKAAYAQMDSYASAYQFAEQHSEITDSLVGIEKTKQIAEMEAAFELNLKEQQIQQQDEEIALLDAKRNTEARLRWVLIVAAGLLIISVLILFSRYQLKRKANALLKNKNDQIASMNNDIRTMNKELEKKMLRAQMDPHFIFNSLNSIQHFVTINDKTSALRYLSKFSKLIRQVLDNSISDRVPLVDEIRVLEAYIELEALRLHHQFEHEIHVDDKIDVYNTEIPFLLIQPYVENAIKHGLRHKKEEGGKLVVQIKPDLDHLICTIEDNGVGRTAAGEMRGFRRHNPVGMSVTQRRLKLLNKTNTAKTSVEIEDLINSMGGSSGTRITLTIPKNLN